MTTDFEGLKTWIKDMAVLIEKNADPEPHHYTPFLNEPELSLRLIELIDQLNDDEDSDSGRAYYSACIFALDICVAQLQSASENGNKLAQKTLKQFMLNMATAISSGKHSLNFWLPILNAFYEVHVDLLPELRDAYLELAGQEDDLTPIEEIDHLNSIREMIEELADLSIFDIAENFFAQSYAMPADFFVDLVADLYSIEQGHDIALLTLLHPKQEVRDIVVATIEQLITTVTLSSVSLSRLQVIKNWYPPVYHEKFNRWIKIQRMKGVVFNTEIATPVMKMKASEIDGGGAQGIFIHLKSGKKNKLCGLLLKQNLGIKDVWITPEIPASHVAKYYDDVFEESVTLREIDLDYLLKVTNHFLALTLQHGSMPNMHLLEIQELLGLHFYPELLDVPYLIEQLSVQIMPFTPDALQTSLKRSKSWYKNKRFTESWFVENAHIDKLVNHCCNFVDGVKICDFAAATNAVFKDEMETQRDKWLFHFLWVSLWLKAKARKSDRTWQDSLLIAYAIGSGMPLTDIAIMHEICRQTVVNSIETMNERRTYLNKE